MPPLPKITMKKRIKVNAVFIALGVIILIVFHGAFFRNPKITTWNTITEILGLALILLGQLLRVSARGFKSEHSDNGAALIQDGPYMLVRNPMYLGVLLIGSGVVLALLQWWALPIFIFVFVLRYVLLIFKEEKKLIGIFSQTYLDYQKRTPRLLPSRKTILHTDIASYLPLKLSWIKREAGPILTVLLLTLCIISLEDVISQGLEIYLRQLIFLCAIVILFLFLAVYLNKRTIALEEDTSIKSKSN